MTATPATPTPTPVPATPTPTPIATATPTPIATATAVPLSSATDYHPSNNGTTYNYAGSSLTTYTRPQQYPSPEPTQTAVVAITQAVTVENPATFGSDTTAIDYHTVESDIQSAPTYLTSSMTYDSYYGYTGTAYTGNFLYFGFSSVDQTGDSVTTVYNKMAGDLADELPEVSSMWSNPPTSITETTIPNGESIVDTVASDGTYVTDVTYQPVGATGMVTNLASVVANLDGSGTYTTPRLGTTFTTANYTYVVQAPTAAGTGGEITETTTIPSAGGTATPEAVSTTVSNWIPTGFLGSALATETDVDSGPVTIPAGCKVPSGLGTTANLITQTKSRVDPMLGQYEVTTTKNYDIGNIGLACVNVDDVLNYYYDFTGQNGATYFSGTPMQVSELQETLGITSEQLMSVARSGGSRFAYSLQSGARVQLAQAHVSAARSLERQRFLRSIATGKRFIARSAHAMGIL